MNAVVANCLTWLANLYTEEYVWGRADERKKSKLTVFYTELREKKAVDFERLTIAEAKELRFGRWTKDSDLWLIPIWLYPLIPVGLELTSISGKKVVFDGKNIDTDTRFGCLAYGIELRE